MMLQHILKNRFNIGLVLLAAIVIAETALDYEILFSAMYKKEDETIYKSSGMVNSMFPHASYARYKNIVDNNIFSVAKGDKKIPVAAKSNDARLPEVRGITITPDEKIILIWSKTQNKSVVVREGETVDNWTVSSISIDTVTVRNTAGNEFALQVNRDKDKK